MTSLLTAPIPRLRRRYGGRSATNAGGDASPQVSQPAQRVSDLPAAVMSHAEQAVETLSREIAKTEARIGLLRRQRENLLNWIFRQAVWSKPRPAMSPGTDHDNGNLSKSRRR